MGTEPSSQRDDHCGPGRFWEECSVPIPPRIAQLLERHRPTGRERTWYPTGMDERAVHLHEYFLRSEREPIALRRARGLAYVLSKVPIAIHDDERIVGQVGLEDVATTRPAELARAWRYWAEESCRLEGRLDGHETSRVLNAIGLTAGGPARDGHTIPDFAFALRHGLPELQARAAERLGAPGLPESQRTGLAAMAIALGALVGYMARHTRLAREMGGNEPDAERSRELAEIAGVCDRLCQGPPTTFHEALQLVWFVHLGLKMDDGGIGHSFGRFDQYPHPFLRADLDAGRLDLCGAGELLALFWIKLNTEGDDIAHLSLGGVLPDGSDATNELSYLCLQVDRWVRRKQPNLSTRVHAGTPDAYWLEIARAIRSGAGHPAVFNDDVIVPGLVDLGFTVEDARDHAQVGCVETYLPGRAAAWMDCYINLPKCLELVLNDGRDMIANVRVMPPLAREPCAGTFDGLYDRFLECVRRAVFHALTHRHGYDLLLSAHAPMPLFSALTPRCLETGKDAVDGAPYVLTGAYLVGLGTVVDSLAAVRELVFDQREVTLADMVDALRADFAGYEDMRRLCRLRAPKYGNDDDRADDLARRVVDDFGRIVRECPSPSSRHVHYGMVGSVVSHTAMGQRTAASANGRRAGETLSDGGSPSHGCAISGPTAALRSLSKPDYRVVPGGAAVNLRLSPGDVTGDDGLERLVGMLRTYFAMGGMQLQVTVVDTETLMRARGKPDEYRDLVVRVAGFTAYFVSLPEALQDEIVSRAAGAP